MLYHLFGLPKDVVLLVVSQLNFSDLLHLSWVCKRFSEYLKYCVNLMIYDEDDVTKFEKFGCFGVYQWCEKLYLKSLVKGFGNICDYGFQSERLISLELLKVTGVVDNDIIGLKRLEVLKLPKCRGVTDRGIIGMNKMRILDLSVALGVSDVGISGMKRLEEMYMFFNLRITCQPLFKMKDLRIIYMPYNKNVREEVLRRELKKLEKLYLWVF